ncbi:MAG: hypothetical protein OEW97_09090, partial [Gammaproteobacteria bacterium]|nr:hypothetical protein [Gammaproteobacteria bacterium]
MAQSQKQSHGSQSGKERRAYPRYPINLKTQLINSGSGTRAGIIKDYCIGGMYIELIASDLFGGEASGYTPRINDMVNVVT